MSYKQLSAYQDYENLRDDKFLKALNGPRNKIIFLTGLFMMGIEFIGIILGGLAFLVNWTIDFIMIIVAAVIILGWNITAVYLMVKGSDE